MASIDTELSTECLPLLKQRWRPPKKQKVVYPPAVVEAMNYLKNNAASDIDVVAKKMRHVYSAEVEMILQERIKSAYNELHDSKDVPQQTKNAAIRKTVKSLKASIPRYSLDAHSCVDAAFCQIPQAEDAEDEDAVDEDDDAVDEDAVDHVSEPEAVEDAVDHGSEPAVVEQFHDTVVEDAVDHGSEPAAVEKFHDTTSAQPQELKLHRSRRERKPAAVFAQDNKKKSKGGKRN